MTDTHLTLTLDRTLIDDVRMVSGGEDAESAAKYDQAADRLVRAVLKADYTTPLDALAPLPDPRTKTKEFWEALTDEDIFYLLQFAPKVAIWRKTKLGNVTLDSAVGQTQAVGGLDPNESMTASLKAREYRVSNTKNAPLAWRK